MRHEIFSQSYKDGDSEVRCSWGISGEAMSFLVIDATSESSADAKYSLAADDKGSHGILECADGIRCIDMTGTVVYVTEDCVGGTKLPMSASQLSSYLGSRKYPLSLAGIESYYRDCSA